MQLVCDLIVTDLKSIGLDLSLGYDNLDELNDILQEIIIKENPSFQVSIFSIFLYGVQGYNMFYF